MNRSRILLVGLISANFSLAAHATGNPVPPGQLATRVAQAQKGSALSLPRSASPTATLFAYLRGQGQSEATLQSLKLQGQSRRARDGRLHLRMAQEVSGLMVYDTYVKATFGQRGELLHVIENLAPAAAGGVGRASVDESAALAAAFRELKIPGAVPAVTGRRGEATRFARGALFVDEPLVTRVAVPMSDGTLSAGFLVQAWRLARNQLSEVLVDGKGRVVEVVGRTNTESYKVFAEDPVKSAQSVVAGPGGWLFAGNHRSIDIAGNNAHAYLDAINDGAPDTGGSTVSDGNFLSTFDAGIQPSEPVNRNVAVQNLFYLNNLIHDALYDYGFSESAGNFQEDNMGNGGRGSDSVNAEAQDGGGTDNANFATPRDGQNPRMQMYLWSSADADHEVVVNAPGGIAGTYAARGAAFGPALSSTGLADDVVLATDGGGISINDGCEAIDGSVAGKIAIIDRGNCAFTVKVKNAQLANAVGVIIDDNVVEAPFTMGGTDATITIPSVMISQADGTAIKGASGVNATLRLRTPAPIMRDGDLDSDIVWHEYGHGLTWRMIGRMDGPMSGAIGEGMSDVLAIIVNDDDVVGEYSFSNAGGIRSEAYANYSRTYGDVAGTQVHFDGEVYAAIGWRLWQNFQGASISKDVLLGHLVDGMNYTPSHPKFENMRDGILSSVAGSGRECLVWDAFADYGVGVGAKGTVRGSTVTISESFVLPTGCSPIP